MPSPPLQRFSVGCFAAGRRLLARARAWVQARPRWAAWLYGDTSEQPELRYREFNEWYFAHFGEQERMLADKPRMAFYHAAIARHIQPGDRVVDLGTGTGILAALAARRGAARVFAIDHSKILKSAKTLAAHNGIERVEFIATHSKEFSVDPPVDVILHEQMGDCLFDEAMVANVCDLRDRILKPGGLILPSCFDFYCEPVTLNEERRVPFLWELEVHGFDYSCLERNRPQEPGYYRLRGSDLGLVDHLLGDPEPVLSIDLHTLREEEMPRAIHFTREVRRPGRLDGFAVYFSARVDGDLSLSSSPVDPGRAPHWGFRILRAERDDLAVGDRMDITLRVGRWPDPDSWRWSYEKNSVRRPGSPDSGDPISLGEAPTPQPAR